MHAAIMQHTGRHMESSTLERSAPVGSLWSSPLVQISQWHRGSILSAAEMTTNEAAEVLRDFGQR